jgi:hypothetical protein
MGMRLLSGISIALLSFAGLLHTVAARADGPALAYGNGVTDASLDPGEERITSDEESQAHLKNVRDAYQNGHNARAKEDVRTYASLRDQSEHSPKPAQPQHQLIQASEQHEAKQVPVQHQLAHGVEQRQAKQAPAQHQLAQASEQHPSRQAPAQHQLAQASEQHPPKQVPVQHPLMQASEQRQPKQVPVQHPLMQASEQRQAKQVPAQRQLAQASEQHLQKAAAAQHPLVQASAQLMPPQAEAVPEDDDVQVTSVQHPQSVPRALPAEPPASPAQPQYRQAYQAPRTAPPQPVSYQQPPEYAPEPAYAAVSNEDQKPDYTEQTYAPPPPVRAAQYVPVYGQPIYVPQPPVQAIVRPVIMVGNPPPFPGYRNAYWARQYRRSHPLRYRYSLQTSAYQGWQ